MQSKIAHAAERKAFSVALDQIIKAASGDDREKNLDKLINMASSSTWPATCSRTPPPAPRAA